MKPENIKNIACIGSGLIGSSWATNFLFKGYSVNLYDIGTEQLDQARERIISNLIFLSEKEIISPEQTDDFLSKITFTTSIEAAVENVQFIQESGPENYEIKQNIIKEIDQYAPTDAIIATSTSGLLVSKITEHSELKHRCIGAHPYNPPHLIPLVELAPSEFTNPEVTQLTYAFYQKLNKEPIILKKEVLGFIANRLQMALYREALDLVVNGVCTVEDVDKASCFGPGLRYAIMGPNLLYHLGGGEHGLEGLLNHIGPSIEMWWKDMASWTAFPENSKTIAVEGVLEELKTRPSELGNSMNTLKSFRDDLLVDILKLHKKI